ncbi:MAG: hypothetical protein R3C68_09585 [Myxococcota bacterium]
MAIEFTDVLRNTMRRLGGWVFGRLASSEFRSDSDLLSYALFDGRLAATMIELGRAER